MSQNENLTRRSATEIKAMLEKRDISVTDLIEATLAQIDTYNEKINAVVTLNERALDDAKRLDANTKKGQPLKPLHGLPVGIKDVTPVAGLRTTFGSPLYADYVPKEDALVVSRLREAGAIIIGKTNCPEFAAGGNTFNDVFGCTRNPWDPALSPGGSTGGGAAGLVTGMMALAEGTDLGGSLRIPASFCGIVGLRPSPGLIPTYPSDYLWDNMQVTGTMARTAEDIALSLQALSGQNPLCPVYQPTKGRDFLANIETGLPQSLRIAYCKDISGIGVEESIETACRAAAFDLKQAGAVVEEIEFDLTFGRKAFLAIRGYWMVAHQYKRLDKTEQLGSNVAGNIEAGLALNMEEFAEAEQARGKIWQIFRDFFSKYDFLLTPCMAVPPFPVEQNYPETIAGKKMKNYVDWIAPTFTLSLTSLPVASVPCGLDKSGLPAGLQIVGPPLGEEKVLTVAKQIQQMQPIGLPDLEQLNQK